ncbi:hypothetical protein MNAN1_003153 [Malassezia nana]|uniref:Arylamine N-acetyltransferase n=1 Tax=Malassezia nana TaxID=180528 RepID=A0AAF0J3L8_9BASI|nr:hypothetical protein MNAN1_003153 [Malassezia nana]
MNLTAYLKRIGFTGATIPPPTLATLKELHRLHPKAIPFENLDPILGHTVSINLKDLENKLVQQKRGGYCYEQNLLFMNVLKEIGYKNVKPFSGRVFWVERQGFIPPSTHMLLSVDVDNTIYLADVGFGSATFSGPVRMVLNEEQDLPLHKVRLVDVQGQEAFGYSDYLVQLFLKGAWKNVYAFRTHPVMESDVEVYNYYVSTHPNSIFTNKFMAAILGPDHTTTLTNRVMNIRYLDGREENHQLAPEEVREKLQSQFGIEMPESIDLTSVFARF